MTTWCDVPEMVGQGRFLKSSIGTLIAAIDAVWARRAARAVATRQTWSGSRNQRDVGYPMRTLYNAKQPWKKTELGSGIAIFDPIAAVFFNKVR